MVSALWLRRIGDLGERNVAAAFVVGGGIGDALVLMLWYIDVLGRDSPSFPARMFGRLKLALDDRRLGSCCGAPVPARRVGLLKLL